MSALDRLGDLLAEANRITKRYYNQPLENVMASSSTNIQHDNRRQKSDRASSKKAEPVLDSRNISQSGVDKEYNRNLIFKSSQHQQSSQQQPSQQRAPGPGSTPSAALSLLKSKHPDLAREKPSKHLSSESAVPSSSSSLFIQEQPIKATPSISDTNDGAYPSSNDLSSCPDCGRKFNHDSFSKHVKICQKVFQSKRKAFDARRLSSSPTSAQPSTSASSRGDTHGKNKGGLTGEAIKPISGSSSHSIPTNRDSGSRPKPPVQKPSVVPMNQSYVPETSHKHGNRESSVPSTRVKPTARAVPISKSYNENEYMYEDDDDDKQNYASIPSSSYTIPENAVQDDLDRQPCRVCSRKFNPISLAKHEAACLKLATKKRKVFDSRAARVAGTEAAQFVNKEAAASVSAKSSSAPKQRKSVAPASIESSSKNNKANWRDQHQALMATMEMNRQIKKAELLGVAPESLPGFNEIAAAVPSSGGQNLIPCPHCGRRFNSNAAERHIPKCQSIIAKPKLLRANLSRSSVSSSPASVQRSIRR